MVNDYILAPPDATWTDNKNVKRCWNCGFYNFKSYGGEDHSSGKCFRDYSAIKKVWYVDGLMTCPGWKADRTVDNGD